MPQLTSTNLPPSAPTSLRVVRWSLGLVIATAFPLSAVAVFGFGVDRHRAADVLSCVYAFGLVLLFASSFLPLPALRGWDRAARVGSAALLFLGVSFATHLSWELLWRKRSAPQRWREVA